MKKILIVTFCILLVCTVPMTVFAAGADEGGMTDLVSKKFEEWVLPHIEEISVIVTLAISSLYQIRKNRLLTRSMGTMNHNTVTVAEQSAGMMTKAREGLENAALAVKSYEARIEELLEQYRTNAADKERLEAELCEMKSFCKRSAQANIEFANELAELLSLANIPDYKRHLLEIFWKGCGKTLFSKKGFPAIFLKVSKKGGTNFETNTLCRHSFGFPNGNEFDG